jgi:hypothetical protein
MNGRTPGSFKISNQRGAFALQRDPQEVRARRRIARIISSIQREVEEGGTARVRQILKAPRELYRIELEFPEMSYERTTIVDRDTLAALLEGTPEPLVRERFIFRT